MQKVLKNVKDDNLRAYIVWLPMLRSDDRKAAEKRVSEFSDKRLTYFWDGDRLTGKLWQDVLEMKFIMWDVYFLYGKDAKWDEVPTNPNFWMHQLGLLKKVPRLNRVEFESKAKELLRQPHAMKKQKRKEKDTR